MEGQQTWVVSSGPEEVLGCTVPRTMSVAQAKELEQKLTTRMKQDVLVMSDNVELVRFEPVDEKEVATLLKGVEE